MSESGAARAYKDVIAGLSDAADELRGRERVRATELTAELGTLRRQMLAASDRSALTRIGVQLQWEDVLDALWTESWLQLRPRPDPDPDPRRAADLAALDVALEEASAELQAAVKRRRFGLPGR